MKTFVTLLLLFTAMPAQEQAKPKPPQEPGFSVTVELPCNRTDFILKMLKDKYREVATAGGISKDTLVRLFESHDAGNSQTWTIIISIPNGTSCIIRGGSDWISDKEIIPGDPS